MRLQTALLTLCPQLILLLLLWLARPSGADVTMARTVQLAETQQCLSAHRPTWWPLLARAAGLLPGSGVTTATSVRAGAYFESYLSTGHAPCEALARVRSAARPLHVTAAALAAECAAVLGGDNVRVSVEAPLMICLRTSRRIGHTALLWTPEQALQRPY